VTHEYFSWQASADFTAAAVLAKGELKADFRLSSEIKNSMAWFSFIPWILPSYALPS